MHAQSDVPVASPRRPPPVIAFTGLKGAGKDTAAAVLVGAGYRHLKFAGPLKAMLSALLAWQGVPPATAQEMLEGGLRETPSDVLGGCSPRQAMQTLGTEWGREMIAPELWVETAERAVWSSPRPAVFSDLRFANEAAMVKRLGGLVVRVERPGRAVDAHASEAGIADLPADFVLHNGFGSASEFAAHVAREILGSASE